MERRIAKRAVGLALGLLLFCVPAFGGAIYLKDGFTLHGNVRREAELIADPATGQMIPIMKGTNFFIVDDRVRLTIFSHLAVQDADPEANIRRDFLDFVNPLRNTQPKELPKPFKVLNVPQINDNWQRMIKLLGPPNPASPGDPRQYSIRQQITSMSPYATKIESQYYILTQHYLTREMGPDFCVRLLESLPELSEKEQPDIEKRMKKFRFLLQAGWLDHAGKVLASAKKDLPDQMERIERSQSALKQEIQRTALREAEQAFKVGRYKYSDKLLQSIAQGELDTKASGEALALRTKLEAGQKPVEKARKLLSSLGSEPLTEPFASAIPMIRDSVGPDSVERLEPFVVLGSQFEKEKTEGKQPANSREEVLALAVTGWVMGRESAEPRVEAAGRVWASREFVLNYLRTIEAAGRRKLLETYEANKPLSVEEMTQLVGLLPPADPAEIPANTGTIEERRTAIPWSQSRPINYSLQLPPDMQPGRSYPVLIVLHHSQEKPGEALARWSADATRNGFILAAPHWTNDRTDYTYSAEEHAAVTDLVRDLRRRYPVDSDRVFLTGLGNGATMAYDVGMAHPDLFAGILPFNGTPRPSTVSYYQRNAQYLPFYSVCGEFAGDSWAFNRRLYEVWCGRGYSSILTMYKGRWAEFFSAEIPIAFDWMSRKKRANGFPVLGRGFATGNQSEEFVSWRPGDNHFYWISVEAYNEKFMNPDMGRTAKQPTPAAVQAEIREGNAIAVNTRGVKKAKVWLGRTWDANTGARSMIDFDKPVTLTVNRATGKPMAVKPSLSTMLEDLFERGDRQRLFFASIDLTNLN